MNQKISPAWNCESALFLQGQVYLAIHDQVKSLPGNSPGTIPNDSVYMNWK